MKNQNPEERSVEIGILELFNVIWRAKSLVAAITAIFIFLGFGYAFIAPSVYEARVDILPPSISDLAELHKFKVFNPSIETKVSDPFNDFLSILRSNQLRKKFLMQEGVLQSLFEKDISHQKALNSLDKMIKLVMPNKGLVSEASLKFQNKDADTAAQYANQLIKLAINEYQIKISDAFESKREQKIKNLNNQKENFISNHQASLDYEITRLKEAFLLAKKLDIINPQDSMNIHKPASKTITAELRYLYSQGTRALKEEIEAISLRNKNPSMVSGLIDIKKELSLIESVIFEAIQVMPVNVDLYAEIPEEPIKPRRKLIVIVSAAFGFLLGLMFVLIRYTIHNR